MAARPRATAAPPLLRLCVPPVELSAKYPDLYHHVENALVDLAIATTCVRRAHRLGEGDHVQYVHHYTGEKTFKDLFPAKPDKSYKSPKLLLSPTEVLNDPNEGVFFFQVLVEREVFFDNLGDALLLHRTTRRADSGLGASDPLVFVASLCIDRDNLNLWRFYGSAKGVSFGVHRSQFDLETDEGVSDDYKGRDKLYSVKYGDEAVGAALDHLMPALTLISEMYTARLYRPFKTAIIKSVSDVLGTVAFLFKTPSYEVEQECRLLRIQSIGDVRRAGRYLTIGDVGIQPIKNLHW